jgi:hypothetical protein
VKRKPTSRDDFLKTVARVKHPDLEDVHKIWLMGLSHYASATGEHAYPGYDALCEITDRKYDRQRLYSKHCVKLGLIQVTRKGNGPHSANEYRFCLENPAYPDDYLGRHVDPASYDKRDEDKRDISNSRLSREAGLESASTVPASPIPLADPRNPLGGGSDYHKHHQKQHQQQYQQTTWKQHPRVASIKKTIAAIDVAFEKSESKTPKTTKEHVAAMATLIIAYGSAIVLPVWENYLPRHDSKLTWSYYEFIEHFDRELMLAEQSATYGSAIWEVRQDLFMYLIPGQRYGFSETWTPAEAAAVQELEACKEKGHPKYMPLHVAGIIRDLRKRGKVWMEENKERVQEQRDREEESDEESTGN